MLHWALIASGPHMIFPAYGWVLFVAITLWLLTIILFFLILFGVLQKLPSVPWSSVVGKHAAGTLTQRADGVKVFAFCNECYVTSNIVFISLVVQINWLLLCVYIKIGLV